MAARERNVGWRIDYFIVSDDQYWDNVDALIRELDLEFVGHNIELPENFS